MTTCEPCGCRLEPGATFFFSSNVRCRYLAEQVSVRQANGASSVICLRIPPPPVQVEDSTAVLYVWSVVNYFFDAEVEPMYDMIALLPLRCARVCFLKYPEGSARCASRRLGEESGADVQTGELLLVLL